MDDLNVGIRRQRVRQHRQEISVDLVRPYRRTALGQLLRQRTDAGTDFDHCTVSCYTFRNPCGCRRIHEKILSVAFPGMDLPLFNDFLRSGRCRDRFRHTESP